MSDSCVLYKVNISKIKKKIESPKKRNIPKVFNAPYLKYPNMNNNNNN